MAAFDNNSVLLLDPATGSVKSTIYPPPTPTNIQKTLYSLALKRVFVFLKTGTFCVYKVDDRETATLEKLQFPKQLKDYEGKSLTQTITSLTLCCLEPPQVDSEIFSEAFKYNPSADETKKTRMKAQHDEVLASDSSDSDLGGEISCDLSESEGEQPSSRHKSDLQVGVVKNRNTAENQDDAEIEKFLVAGLSKGSVIFVKVTKIEHIYARFSVHKQQIDHIHELKK